LKSKLVFGVAVLYLVILTIPTLIFAQDIETTATVTVLQVEIDEAGNAIARFDVEISDAMGEQLFVGFWPVYSDNQKFIGNINGVEENTDYENDFVSFETLDIDSNTQTSTMELVLPGDGFPIGNYDWIPYIAILDSENRSLFGEFFEEIVLSVQSDITETIDDNDETGVIINKVFYEIDDEFLYVDFDFEMSGFAVGDEVVVSGYLVYLEVGDEQYVASENIDPDYTDEDGDIFDAYQVSMDFEPPERTVWWEGVDNVFFMQFPLVNLPEGEYSVYPYITVFQVMKDDEGNEILDENDNIVHEFIYEVDYFDVVIPISK